MKKHDAGAGEEAEAIHLGDESSTTRHSSLEFFLYGNRRTPNGTHGHCRQQSIEFADSFR
jgi:hypothetical protein